MHILSEGEEAFISLGFRNYKKAIEKFFAYEKSSCHKFAINQIKLVKGPTIDATLNSQLLADQLKTRYEWLGARDC